MGSSEASFERATGPAQRADTPNGAQKPMRQFPASPQECSEEKRTDLEEQRSAGAGRPSPKPKWFRRVGPHRGARQPGRECGHNLDLHLGRLRINSAGLVGRGVPNHEVTAFAAHLLPGRLTWCAAVRLLTAAGRAHLAIEPTPIEDPARMEGAEENGKEQNGDEPGHAMLVIRLKQKRGNRTRMASPLCARSMAGVELDDEHRGNLARAQSCLHHHP